jgi:predicted thioredoxin/glutaredoxin
MRVVLVTRQGCHLCDQALDSLRSLGVEPEVADVDKEPDLFELYDWRVPVVLVDGRIAAEGKIDAERLRGYLASTDSAR